MPDDLHIVLPVVLTGDNGHTHTLEAIDAIITAVVTRDEDLLYLVAEEINSEEINNDNHDGFNKTVEQMLNGCDKMQEYYNLLHDVFMRDYFLKDAFFKNKKMILKFESFTDVP
jgi:hypothetical protein